MEFINATVFTGTTFVENATVRIENGEITAVETQDGAAQPGANAVDLAGDYLVPGFIDLQLYGGAEHFLNETPTPETVRHIYHSHRRNGTTSLLPTLHSTSLDVMLRGIDAVRTVRSEEPFGVLGTHVEGPYFNVVKRGAHSLRYVRDPEKEELHTLLTEGGDAIAILTFAPEIFSDELLAQLFREKSDFTQLSVGHSNATFAEATAAFSGRSGLPPIPLATHLYNAMRGFESREPGIVGAIFDHDAARVSLIADGSHSDVAALRLAHRVLGPDRIFLISDALFANPGGLPRAQFTLGDFRVHYEPATAERPGRYANDEGKLAGSALTLADCVRFAVTQAGLPLLDTLRMATATPANLMGLGDRLGHVAPGYRANLVRLDKELNVTGVWSGGVQV